jgi:hypothetical protein
MAPRAALALVVAVGGTVFGCDAVLAPIPPLGGGAAGATGARKYLPPGVGDDVRARYGAVGDGVADDTAALARALADGRNATNENDYYTGRRKALRFPAGTYLVSDTLAWVGCCVQLQGEGEGVTTIKLRDGATGFGDAAHPKAVVTMPNGNTSRGQYLRDLTIDVGAGNPGAIAIDFAANDIGSVRDVTVRAAPGSGATGLSLVRDWPGPALLRDVTVDGFDTGIAIAGREYGVVLEHVRMQNQRRVGLDAADNVTSVRDLVSRNGVTAVHNRGIGLLTLVDADLQGGSGGAAVVNEAALYARNVRSGGYAGAIASGGATTATFVRELVSGTPAGLFSTRTSALALPVAETPRYEDADPSHWAVAMTEYQNTDLIDPALSSGKPVVYFPGRHYLIGGQTHRVPASVRKIVGLNCGINRYDDVGLTLVVDEGSQDPLLVEGFAYGVTIDHRSRRTVAVAHGNYAYRAQAGAGDVFLDDVQTGELRFVAGQRAWGRQVNSSGEGTKLVSDGAQAWLLGFESEGIGPPLAAKGGAVEILGALIYPAATFPATGAAPAFDLTDADASIVAATSSYIPNGMHPVIVRETRAGETRTLGPEKLQGRFLPLYSGGAP